MGVSLFNCADTIAYAHHLDWIDNQFKTEEDIKNANALLAEAWRILNNSKNVSR